MLATDGRVNQLVHQHAIADAPAHPGDHADDHADDHGTGFDHADHTAARLLIPAYDLTSHMLVCGPAGIAHRAAKTEIARPAPALRTTLLPTHDPPLRLATAKLQALDRALVAALDIDLDVLAAQ